MTPARGPLEGANVELRIYLRVAKKARKAITTVRRRTDACINTIISFCLN